jgi:hypothetical protein
MHPIKFLQFFLISPLLDVVSNCKIVIPLPHDRPLTILNGEKQICWFDVMDLSENTFKMPSD